MKKIYLLSFGGNWKNSEKISVFPFFTFVKIPKFHKKNKKYFI